MYIWIELLYTQCVYTDTTEMFQISINLIIKYTKNKKPFDLPNMSGEEEEATRDDAIFQSLKCLFNIILYTKNISMYTYMFVMVCIYIYLYG